ncbi:MAG: GldG family protein, partial [Chloroflexi bacterium]|nr:GldG family protein [Chloroflexota bacterium]
IVASLDDLLTIELFQSKEPPVEVDLVARDVRDFLKDLASTSGDNVKLIHRFPDVDEDDARKAQLAGIPPVQFNIQTSTGLEIKNGFLGVALTYTNLRESIPFVESIDGFEYRVATLAYGMLQADVERKTIGFLAGHGEKSVREDLTSLVSLLAGQYNISEVTAVDDQAPDLSEIDVLIVAGPTQRMAEAVYGSIRDYLASGGKAMIMIDPVIVDQQSMFAFPNQFHFGEFVEDYGVVIEDNIVFDLRSNETLAFNSARGNIFLPYEYWARVPTVDKKVAGQVESVLMPWASSIGTTESRVGEVEFIPLLRTTPFGVADYSYGDVSPNNPSLANPNSRPFENDIGVAVEGRANGEGTFRLIVIGDSDWLTDRIVGRAQENLAMGLNLVDWLAQEDALADIRSKVITTRALIFDSPAQRNIVQYANILGLPLLFIMLGAVRYARRRRINMKVYISEE